MPYCKKCGKWIASENGLCDDCRNAELIFGEFSTPASPEVPFAPAAPVAPATDPGTRMDGFPKALTSVIVGVASLIILLVFYKLAAVSLGASGGDVDTAIALLVIGSLLAVAGIVVSVIFGVKSIMKFVDSKRRGKIKPIATLVCGICGCAASAVTAFYLMIAAILLLAAL